MLVIIEGEMGSPVVIMPAADGAHHSLAVYNTGKIGLLTVYILHHIILKG